MRANMRCETGIHRKFLLMYHIIFVCKYRKAILVPFSEELKQTMVEISKESNFEILGKYYWGENTLWSEGYFAPTIGNVSKEAAEYYIRNQG